MQLEHLPIAKTKTRRAYVMPVLGLLVFYQILTAFMFKGVAMDNTATFLGWGDASAQSYPWCFKVWHALQRGELALWDFGIYSGTSFAGELQTAPFYPLHLLFAPFARNNDPHLVDLFLIFHFGLAASFMHLFLREMKLNFAACFVGACIFAFIGPITTRVMNQPNLFCGLIYLPAVTLFALKAAHTEDRFRTAVCVILSGLFLGLSILAGHVHSYIHMSLCLILTCFICFLARQKAHTHSGALKLVLIACGAFLFSIAIAAVQLIATKEYLELAYKWYSDGHFTKAPHIVPLAEMARNAIPYNYLWSIISDRLAPSSGPSIFATYSALPLLLVSFASWKSIPSRLGWSCIVLAVLLSAAGHSLLGPILHSIPLLNLVREPDRALHIFGFGIAIATAAGLNHLIKHRPKRIPSIAISLFFCFGVVSECARFDQHMVVNKNSPTAPSSLYIGRPTIESLTASTLVDGSQFRFRAIPDNLLPANVGETTSAYNIFGYRASMLGSYYDFFSKDSTLSDKTMDLLGVRYLITDHIVSGLPLLAKSSGIYIQERRSALPIFWLLDASGKHERIASSIDWKENSARVFLLPLKKGRLIFSQPIYPGWCAYVDGIKREITPFEIFNSIQLSKDDRVVYFIYSPSWLLPFGSVSLFTLASGIFALVFLIVDQEYAVEIWKSLGLKRFLMRFPKGK